MMEYLQNIKIWCNNLGLVGKWGGLSFVFGAVLAVSVFGRVLPLQAYVLDPKSSSPQATELKINYNPIGKINDTSLPVNDLINSALNGLRLNQNINMGTGIPLSPIKSSSQYTDFSKFFSSSKVSSNDIMSFLKEAAVTGINLTILVISITAQVLKGLLSIIR